MFKVSIKKKKIAAVAKGIYPAKLCRAKYRYTAVYA